MLKKGDSSSPLAENEHIEMRYSSKFVGCSLGSSLSDLGEKLLMKILCEILDCFK